MSMGYAGHPVASLQHPSKVGFPLIYPCGCTPSASPCPPNPIGCDPGARLSRSRRAPVTQVARSRRGPVTQMARTRRLPVAFRVRACRNSPILPCNSVNFALSRRNAPRRLSPYRFNANQITWRGPLPLSRALTATSSTRKPALRRRLAKTSSEPADHTANMPPGFNAALAVCSPARE